MNQQKSAIVRDITELKQIDIELKRYRKEIKKLRDAKENCEKRILDYLDANDQPGIRLGSEGITVIAEHRRKRKYEKKQQKIERGVQILEKNGVYNSKDTLNELLEAMRGESLEKPSIRFIG